MYCMLPRTQLFFDNLSSRMQWYKKVWITISLLSGCVNIQHCNAVTNHAVRVSVENCNRALMCLKIMNASATSLEVTPTPRTQSATVTRRHSCHSNELVIYARDHCSSVYRDLLMFTLTAHQLLAYRTDHWLRLSPTIIGGCCALWQKSFAFYIRSRPTHCTQTTTSIVPYKLPLVPVQAALGNVRQTSNILCCGFGLATLYENLYSPIMVDNNVKYSVVLPVKLRVHSPNWN